MMFASTGRDVVRDASRYGSHVTIKPRLLVADDNPLVFEQLVAIVDDEFDVIGHAVTGLEAIEDAIRFSPDVVVLDISMPVMTGLCAARQLREKGVRMPIVFLTVHEDQEYVNAALDAGGLGYVLKSRIASDLVRAIKAALDGRRFVSAPLSV
jgi:DNA-binding NarL/FixJ family response regulator